jgi:2-(1,2-epoxy-1,2-dihydrophenyl)acetyl-CoA isomerase
MKTGQMQGFEISLDEYGVAIVCFNRPERLNALTRAAKRDLIESLLQAQMDDRVRVVLFTGAGKAFVAGDDTKPEHQSAEHPTLLESLPYVGTGPLRTYDSLRSVSQLLNVTIRHLDKPTIAALNGPTIQSGLSIALASDFRIASREARLGSATLRMGFLPDEGGHWLLVQYLGVAAANDFLLRNRIVDADRALELGLVHEVVEPEELMDRARELARELASGPQVATRLLKRAILLAADSTFEQALDDIATKAAITDHHPDAIEGRAAFREKRPPRFNQWLDDVQQ